MRFRLMVLLLASLCGCHSSTSHSTPMKTPDAETPLKFKSTAAAQDAVFCVSSGWTGGMGEAVFEGESSSLLFVDDLPVFLSTEAERAIMARVQVPDCWSGSPLIKVSARVELVRCTRRNFSIPGAPEKTYYSLKLLELHAVFSQYDPC